MRLVILLLMSISSVLVSCAHDAPTPPKEVYYGFYINNGTPYVRLQEHFTGRVLGNYPLNKSNSMDYICSPTDHFSAYKAYADKLAKYVQAIEKDLQQCKGRR